MNERKLYLGIPLSGKSKTRIAQSVEKWSTFPVFPVRSENLFVSVLFLGFVTDENTVWMAEAVRDVCAGIEPFDIMFSSITTAPDEGQVKTVQLVGEENTQLLALRNALEHELMGKTVDGKRYRPRVTLAQVKRHEFAAVSEAKLAIFPQPISISEPVSSIILYECVGAGAKRQYLVMDEFPLG
jgi:2'-5' RNA ligase